MADTRTQMRVEQWVREVWMTAQFNRQFTKQRARLTCGGLFEFDAVTADGLFAAVISTSCLLTSSGKNAIGKRMKIKADLFYLLLSDAERKLAIFTDITMKEHFLKEKRNGRIPVYIELWHAQLPPTLQAELIECQRLVSAEVSPQLTGTS